MTTFGAKFGQRPEAGVSLIATLVALGIMLIGIYAFAQAFSYTRAMITSSRLSRAYVEAELAIQGMLWRSVRQAIAETTLQACVKTSASENFLPRLQEIVNNQTVGVYGNVLWFPPFVAPKPVTSPTAALRNAAVARCKVPRVLTDTGAPGTSSQIYFCGYLPYNNALPEAPPVGSFWAARERFVEAYIHLVDLNTGASVPCASYASTPTAGARGFMSLYWANAPGGSTVYRIHSRSFYVAN